MKSDIIYKIRILYYLLFLITCISLHSVIFAGTSFENLTSEDKVQDRIEIFKNKNNPGFRLQMGNMKRMNKEYGIGKVNKAIENFENGFQGVLYDLYAKTLLSKRIGNI